MYKQFINRGAFLVAGWIAVSIGVFSYAYYVTSSLLIAFFTLFVILLMRHFLIGGNLSKRHRLIQELIGENPIETKDDPLLEPDDKYSAKWLKGIGYINGFSQPLWIRLSEEGVVLFFLARSRKPPILFKWEKLKKISVLPVSSDRKEYSEARVLINNCFTKLVVPWGKKFDLKVPKEQRYLIESNGA